MEKLVQESKKIILKNLLVMRSDDKYMDIEDERKSKKKKGIRGENEKFLLCVRFLF